MKNNAVVGDVSRPALNLVWIKRDLRTQDHACFQAAEQEQIPYLPIYIFDPELIAHPRHESQASEFYSRLYRGYE